MWKGNFCTCMFSQLWVASHTSQGLGLIFPFPLEIFEPPFFTNMSVSNKALCELVTAKLNRGQIRQADRKWPAKVLQRKQLEGIFTESLACFKIYWSVKRKLNVGLCSMMYGGKLFSTFSHRILYAVSFLKIFKIFSTHGHHEGAYDFMCWSYFKLFKSLWYSGSWYLEIKHVHVRWKYWRRGFPASHSSDSMVDVMIRSPILTPISQKVSSSSKFDSQKVSSSSKFDSSYLDSESTRLGPWLWLPWPRPLHRTSVPTGQLVKNGIFSRLDPDSVTGITHLWMVQFISITNSYKTN